jgi:hypothetical protein
VGKLKRYRNYANKFELGNNHCIGLLKDITRFPKYGELYDLPMNEEMNLSGTRPRVFLQLVFFVDDTLIIGVIKKAGGHNLKSRHQGK